MLTSKEAKKQSIENLTYWCTKATLRTYLENTILKAVDEGKFEASLILSTEELIPCVFILEEMGYKYHLVIHDDWAATVHIRWDQ